MVFDISEMKKRISDAAPVPHDETPSYKRFEKFFGPFALSATMALVYIITISIDSSLSANNKILDLLPMLSARIDFLEEIGDYSLTGYIAAIAAGLAMVPILVTIHTFWYWRLVLIPRKNRSFNFITLAIMINGFIVLSGLVWIAFFSVPQLFDPSRTGLRIVLLWPIFPALASGVIYLVAEMTFAILVGLIKFTLPHGASNG
jgi:hypothetical protein